MKTTPSIISAALLLVVLSCTKAGETGEAGTIRIGVHSPMRIETKTTEVSSIPSTLYWMATTGTVGGGSESAVWNIASATPVDGVINTGRSQTSPPTTYNYYVTNVSNVYLPSGYVQSSGPISATNDVVYGRVSSSELNPSITLVHVFGRTGTLTITHPTGTTLNSATWKIKGKGGMTGTGGYFNFSTGEFSTTSGYTIVTPLTITSGEHTYLVPGTYTVTCTYSLTYDGITNEFTCSGDITINSGVTTSVTIDVDINTRKFDYTLTPWGNEYINNPSFTP